VGVEGSTLVRQLDALEERGLIERVADKDRRVRRIRLTAAALPVLVLVRDMATRLGREILADVDPEQVARGAAVLHAVREHLQDRESATAEAVPGE
jgi:MarR family transcriptional regulator for hemolysin